MSFVIRIDWLGGLEEQEPSEHAGRYVSYYDPDAQDGRGQMWTTQEPRDAIQSANHTEAIQFYRQASSIKPKRLDGKPNRPLTAFTVSIFDWEKESGD